MALFGLGKPDGSARETTASFMAACRRGAHATYLGDGRVMCRVLDQYAMVVDGNDILFAPNIICDGFWEPEISMLFRRALQPGMTAVDIGANMGYFSLLMADMVGESGQVIAIEANPGVADLVNATIAANALEQSIELHNKALAEKSGTLDFFVSPTWLGNGRLVLDEWEGRYDEAFIQKIQTETGDALLEHLPQVDFIKIDVEGAEHLVWRGLEKTIARNPAITIVMEYNADRSEECRALPEMIEQAGFTLAFADDFGDIVPVTRDMLMETGTGREWMLYLTRTSLPGHA